MISVQDTAPSITSIWLLHAKLLCERTAFTQKLVRFQIVQVDSIGLKCIGIGSRMLHLHLHVAQELYQVIHIQDIRYIMDCHFFRRKQCCTNDLQGFILCALRNNLTGQPVTAFYDK